MSKINDKVLSELVSNQIKKMDNYKKLSYSDLLRISKYLSKSVFNTNDCVLWDGYITNFDKKDKGVYVNFYFKQKKYALHRLLYVNFIGTLFDDEYIKFTCSNKGICCNINHFHKIDKHNLPPHLILKKNQSKSSINCTNKNNTDLDDMSETEFIVNFD
jgi:hypothetical protein